MKGQKDKFQAQGPTTNLALGIGQLQKFSMAGCDVGRERGRGEAGGGEQGQSAEGHIKPPNSTWT